MSSSQDDDARGSYGARGQYCSGGLLLLPSSARWLRLSGRLASLVTRPNAEPWQGWEGQTQGDGFNTLACV